MKPFLIAIIFFCFGKVLSAQSKGYSLLQIVSDSIRLGDSAGPGFTNKAEAKNILKDTLKTGKWIEYLDATGNVIHKGNAVYYRLTVYDEGMPTGIQRYYYFKSNKLAAIIPYKNGRKNGLGRLFFENGKLMKEIPYKNGMINGFSKLYYESGDVMSEIPYKDNKKSGLGKLYFEDGKEKSETFYTDDLKNGIVKVYSESGTLLSEIPCTGDKRNGMEKDYYETGKLKREAPFVNDTIRGVVKNYDEQGNEIH